ncbi:MAG: enoyl-CoA hydratase/isomerase family protein [Nitriliruptorales bacterium]|nr:enoyl-CoA hydratase/isomerase family protein [Nitriliruptorales bacterium]
MGAALPERLEVTVEDGVVSVTIDRGDGNLLTMQMCRALTRLLEEPPEGAHVLRLSARGPAFCLGRERAGETTEDLRDEVRALIGLNRALGTSPLVSVAAVSGDAAGFGVGLAALCDVAVAAPQALLSFPEVTIDLAPAVVLAWLPRIVGRRQAFLLTATGAPISAVRATELGLLTAVAPSAEALPEVVDEHVAALRARSPRVHREIRSFLAAADGASPEIVEALAEERLIIGSLARRRH